MSVPECAAATHIYIYTYLTYTHLYTYLCMYLFVCTYHFVVHVYWCIISYLPPSKMRTVNGEYGCIIA